MIGRSVGSTHPPGSMPHHKISNQRGDRYVRPKYQFGPQAF